MHNQNGSAVHVGPAVHIAPLPYMTPSYVFLPGIRKRVFQLVFFRGNASWAMHKQRRKNARSAPMHIKPKLVRDEDGSSWRCEWPAVASGPSKVDARGTGLFAKQPLKRGTRIDYYGVRLTRSMWDERDDQSYCVEVHGSPYELIDGHPAWSSEWTPSLKTFMPKLPAGATLTRLPKDLMMGGRVNEPIRGEATNVKIFGDDTAAFFETTRRVEAGEELLTLYGRDYVRDYESPYDWIEA